MPEIRWTKPQSDAIQARGEILVSAAAGSGKTAVLVERVMRMIESECNIDELLIVTFTRTAAAQMKEKIADAIAKKIALEPENEHFHKQQILLEKAMITTIDAFCANILKSHFQHLDMDISMNYKNLDEAQLAVVSADVLDEVLDSFYEENDPAFIELMDAFTKGKNDLSIAGVINTLHSYMSAFADKEQWLSERIEFYRANSAAQSPWGQLVLTDAARFLALAMRYCSIAVELLRENEATFEVYGAFMNEQFARIQNAYRAAVDGDWDTLYAYRGVKLDSYPRKTKNMDTELRAKAQVFFNGARDALERANKYLVEDEATFAADNAAIYPVAQELKRLFDTYEKRLFERKTELQSFEFSDIAYLALQILRGKNGTASEVALEYRRKFKGILVDEYQDTNGVQDTIFRLISNHNLFVVGDVKQSIYRFRQAMPEIFIDRRKSLPAYESGADEGCILLKNNFRSEKPITDFVNFVFSRLMSEELGEVDYNEDEYLIANPDRDYSESEAPELHILEAAPEPGLEQMKAAQYESEYIASLIRQQVESGQTLKIGEQRRALTYSDYCVLIRAKTHLPKLKKAFEKYGVPYSTDTAQNLFDTPEVMLVMSFLRAIDNPLRDVDLIAVMYSRIFGFTAEDLSRIRISRRKGSFYGAVRFYAESGDEKCARFLEDLEQYRCLAAVHEPGVFLRRVYEKTGLPELMLAEDGGAVKRANLFKFVSVVELYSEAGYYGLTGLVRFLEKVKANQPDIAAAFLPEGESKVKIMTVHKSKGLEFPVVIVAFTNNKNNHHANNIVLNREYGIGIRPKDKENNVRYDTLAYSAVSLANAENDIAEELRTLYVALTRPKSKLIVTGAFEGSGTRAKKLEEIAALTGRLAQPEKGWLRLNNNYLSWLIACCFAHPDAVQLRAETSLDAFCIDCAQEGNLKVVLPEFHPEAVTQTIPAFKESADEEMVQLILQNFAYRYPYAGSELIESKKTPSALAHQTTADLEYAFPKPSFIPGETRSAAQRGTATHRFMEKVLSFENFRFDRELGRMLRQGFLSPEQAELIDREAVTKFFESDLSRRMARAERIEKEYPVAYLEYAGFFDGDIPESLKNEKVFVDGMIDAVFEENGEAVIVDYKTDKVKTGEELKNRYYRQMELYKRAVEAIWGIPVRCCYLYSFALGEAVCVGF